MDRDRNYPASPDFVTDYSGAIWARRVVNLARGDRPNAGGLGSCGANILAPEDITKLAAEIRQLTDKPFGMNLWVSTFDPVRETDELLNARSKPDFQRSVSIP
jgi:Nitronate monooxygenase